MAVSKYSRKPEIVDAIQYDGTNHQEILDFAPGVTSYEDGKLMLFQAISVVIEPGMWVLLDVGGNYVPHPENFLTYYRPGGGP